MTLAIASKSTPNMPPQRVADADMTTALYASTEARAIAFEAVDIHNLACQLAGRGDLTGAERLHLRAL